MTSGEGAVLVTALLLRDRLVPRPETLALAVAPAMASALLRDALAAGVDRVLRVWPEKWDQGAMQALDGSAAAVRARAWAAAEALRPLVKGGPVLVLAGEKSEDEGHGAFGAFLAHALALPWIHRAAALSPAPEGWVRGWRAQTKLERGYTQEQHGEGASAVVTLVALGGRLSTAAWPAWLASRTAPIPFVAPRIPDSTSGAGVETTLRPPVPRVKRYAVPDAALGAEQRIRALVGTKAQCGGVVIPESEGTVRQAEAVLDLLRQRGYLQAGPAR